ELSDLRLLPSNVMRTLPYTTYIAVGSYAVLCWSREAALLEVCLLTNEILNAVFKKLSTLLLGKEDRGGSRPMHGGIMKSDYHGMFCNPSGIQ
ncbi:unnamed protein product, partial [Cladocopium goreaui]